MLELILQATTPHIVKPLMKMFTYLSFDLPATGLRARSVLGTILAGCLIVASLSTPALAQSSDATTNWPIAPALQASPAATVPTVPDTAAPAVSQARTPQDYRRDAASHLYEKNRKRIYKGRMPPLLYAIGVLQVEVNSQGRVNSLSWMRAPKHAPEVIAEIEQLIKQAEPFPAPARMGRVTYTDTWLWHKSGLFQLDTLTEGQN